MTMKFKNSFVLISLMLALGFAGLIGGQVFAQDATTTPDTSISVLEQTSGPATQVPTAEPTLAVTESAPATEVPSTPAAPKSYWTLALGIALLGVFLYAYARRWSNKPKPAAERCARCGFDLTGKAGPCPQCGSTRRLPKV